MRKRNVWELAFDIIKCLLAVIDSALSLKFVGCMVTKPIGDNNISIVLSYGVLLIAVWLFMENARNVVDNEIEMSRIELYEYFNLSQSVPQLVERRTYPDAEVEQDTIKAEKEDGVEYLACLLGEVIAVRKTKNKRLQNTYHFCNYMNFWEEFKPVR